MATLQKRVEHGATLLDEKMPGWASRINLEVLSIGSCKSCVLGQLYGNYTRGASIVDVPLYYEDDYGFDGVDYEMDALTEEWKAFIEQRQTVES